MHIFLLHKIIIYVQKKTNGSEKTALTYEKNVFTALSDLQCDLEQVTSNVRTRIPICVKFNINIGVSSYREL